ncbi:hypothetical protein G3I60_00135 [Streptomyces sp. SID13666]|uniref:ABC transporter permease n=1 Tax=unclassified Streptomyces TaxID=2593676 RepID=UPI0013BEF18A|nr:MULTISPECIES: hypothetical protein [unclassified Streptomyces]NEA52624.1 hypothetical protein [Streptomyces sp. SID13666]NEA70049.1 hypothetical protein [Streptomyces sp. SID13588]
MTVLRTGTSARGRLPFRALRAAALRRDAGLLLPAALAALLLLVAVAAPLIAPYDPVAGSLRVRLLDPGSPGHLLGTDGQGRDVLSRLVWAARPSLIGGFVPVAIAATAGTALGIAAGLGGRVTEQALLRSLDVLYAFPGILLAMTIATLMPAGLGATVLSLSVVLTRRWPGSPIPRWRGSAPPNTWRRPGSAEPAARSSPYARSCRSSRR